MRETPLVEIFVAHRVLAAGAAAALGPDRAGGVSADRLDAFLSGQRGRRALALADLARLRPAAGPPPFMLTIDDVFRDAATEALPVLERHGVPVLLFVTSGWIDGRERPYEYALAALMARMHGAGKSAEVAYERARRRLKGRTHRARWSAIRRLSAAAGVPPETLETPPALSHAELAALARHDLITIGAHSHTHPQLTTRWPGTVLTEIAGSMRALEAWTGRPVRAFAYPYGAQNWLTRQVARRAGVQWGFSTEPRAASRTDGAARFALPRFDIAASDAFHRDQGGLV